MRSSLTTRVITTPNRSSRNGTPVDRVEYHHTASTSTNGVVDLIRDARKEVSYNYLIGRDGEVIELVPETQRAWSSGSPTDGGKGAAFDRRSIVICFVNSAGSASGWPITDLQAEVGARLTADISDRYGIPITDTTVLTHQELFKRYGASYPTACPGGVQKRKADMLATARSMKGSQPATAPSRPKPSKPTAVDRKLIVDGLLGPETTARLQEALNKAGFTDYQGKRLVVDGVLGKRTVSALQKFLNAKGARDWNGRKLVVDGVGLESNKTKRVGKYRTIWALQHYLKTSRDGWLDKRSSYAIETLQRRLNAGTFK